MGSFATLYASMLRQREVQRQQALEQKRYEDTRVDATYQQALASTAQAEEAKQMEFDRHLKTAELMGKSAGSTGAPKPDGFSNPAVQEWSDAQYGMGDASLQAKQREQRFKADTEAVKWDESRYGKMTPEANQIQADASQRLYGVQGPIRSRTPQNELYREAAARGGRDQVMVFRKDFEDRPVIKNLYESAPQLQRVLSAGQAKTGPGDLAMIMGFARLIEPGARAVTDQDFERAASGGELGPKILGLIQYYTLNGSQLDDTMRGKIMIEAQNQFEASRTSALEDARWYDETILTEGGISSDQVIHPRLLNLLRGGGGGGQVMPQPQAQPQQRDQFDDEFDSMGGGR